MLSPSVFAQGPVIVRSASTVVAVSHRLMTLLAKLRLLCPGLDLVDLVVFERREILNDER
jgi:hypothetical protein